MRLFCNLLLATLLLAVPGVPPAVAGPTQQPRQALRAQKSPWGLRNLEFTTGPDPASVFLPHGPDHVAFWLLWRWLLLDADASASGFLVAPPAGARSATVYDAFGTAHESIDPAAPFTLPLGQSPRIVVWVM